MRGSRAKKLRKKVYGTEGSSRERTYHFVGTTRHADEKRQAYQKSKHV